MGTYFSLTTGMDTFKISFHDFMELPLLWFYQLLNLHTSYAKKLTSEAEKKK